MRPLHIVQGGVENNDKRNIERAHLSHRDLAQWVVPKSARIGDDVVVYIGGYGFFATASIKKDATPHKSWANRYGAPLTAVRLVTPAISLEVIRRKISSLTWANYPRSVTSPKSSICAAIRKLIHDRRRGVLPDFADDALMNCNIDELRKIALLRSSRSAPPRERKSIYRARSAAIKFYVIARSEGLCEGCGEPAPFVTDKHKPYLEPHHTLRVADDGPDHPKNVIALCPNCHRRAHHAKDAEAFNDRLKRKLSRIER